MDKIVEVFGQNLELDFLSGWIKYNRIQKEFSQEALAHGICSVSHLSYFENGKKTLRGEVIEALLRKLNISEIQAFDHFGLVRQQFYNMMFQIEIYNHEAAKNIYEELGKMEAILSSSPYNIEYKIYQLMYKSLVEKESFTTLKQDMAALDKVYTSLSKELQYLYLFISGMNIYKYEDHNKGIERLLEAYKINDTPWINYSLGFSYCFNSERLKALYYFEKALESYERNGRYINALWCHNYIAMCYTDLGLYEKAEEHYKAALTGAEHFNMDNIFAHLYINISHLCLCKKAYEECIAWTGKALKTDTDPLLPACNYVEASAELKKFEECKVIFQKYLSKEHEGSKYYNLFYFHYLSIFHFEEVIFYEEVTRTILPYYENISYLSLCKAIKLKLIEYLEKRRRYKEANKLYKELLGT